MERSEGRETDEGCWTDRNAARPARVPREPTVQASTLPRSGRRYSNRNIRLRLQRPPTPAFGQPPHPTAPPLRWAATFATRGEGHTARAIAANLPADRGGSNLGAAGSAR